MINGRRRSLRNSQQSSATLIPVVPASPALNRNNIPSDIIDLTCVPTPPPPNIDNNRVIDLTQDSSFSQSRIHRRRRNRVNRLNRQQINDVVQNDLVIVVDGADAVEDLTNSPPHAADKRVPDVHINLLDEDDEDDIELVETEEVAWMQCSNVNCNVGIFNQTDVDENTTELCAAHCGFIFCKKCADSLKRTSRSKCPHCGKNFNANHYSRIFV